MGILANGFIGATGVYQTFGATVLNNAYPSARLANFARTGAKRNITAGEGISSGLVSLPSGYRHPGAWMMPQKPGALSARNTVTGSGSASATALAVKLATADLTGDGDLAAFGSLIVQLVADLVGSGDISDADLKAFLQAVAGIGGTGGISSAQATGLGKLIAAMTGLGSVDSTLTGSGELTADITVTGTGLSTANVGEAVWSALAAANNSAGSMGEKLNDAGSASNPWTEIIESGLTAAEILKLITASVAGSATGLESGSPVFKSIDGTVDRITATYSGGTRTVTGRDVT